MAENFENILVKNTLQGNAFPIRSRVRAATVSPGTLATDFENGDTIDGIVLATGDRILIKDQVSAVENGIYNVQVTGTPIRSTDFAVGVAVSTLQMYVSSGTVNSQTTWICDSSSGSDIVGTDNITFEQATGRIDGLTPGSYSSANITVDSNGRVITAVNGNTTRYTKASRSVRNDPGTAVGELTNPFKVFMDVLEISTGGFTWNTGTSVFTAPLDGYYDIYAIVSFNNGTNILTTALVYKNGSEVAKGPRGASSTFTASNVRTIVPLNTNDTIEIYALNPTNYQDVVVANTYYVEISYFGPL